MPYRIPAVTEDYSETPIPIIRPRLKFFLFDKTWWRSIGFYPPFNFRAFVGFCLWMLILSITLIIGWQQ